MLDRCESIITNEEDKEKKTDMTSGEILKVCGYPLLRRARRNANTMVYGWTTVLMGTSSVRLTAF